MSSSEEEMAKRCYGSSVRKAVTAAILLLILEVNMIAIYTYTMVDNSDLTDAPRKEDIVVRVKRVNMGGYLNTVTETTFGSIISSVKHSLHMDGVEESSSGDGQFPDEQTPAINSYDQPNQRKHPNNTALRNKNGNHALKRAFPSYYIIGARSCGTDILKALMNRHPQVVTMKTSPHYFDNDVLFRKGDQWYQRHLPRVADGKVLVEVNEDLFSSTSAPSRLKRKNPTAKFIIVLRDPLERTLADFLTEHKGLEGSGEQSYEASFIKGNSTTVNQQSPIIRASLYDIHLKKWLSLFGFQHLLFIDYAQMMTQPLTIMKKVEKFLSVRPFYHKRSFNYVNKKTLCTHGTKGSSHPPVCLVQDHPDLSLPLEIDEALKAYYTQHMNMFWTLVSNDLSVSELESLIN